MKKLTNRQKKILAVLRMGGGLVEDVGGWTPIGKTRRIRYETQDALSRTGELVRVHVQGSHIKSLYFIVHESQVDKFFESRPNLTLVSAPVPVMGE